MVEDILSVRVNIKFKWWALPLLKLATWLFEFVKCYGMAVEVKGKK